LAYNKLIAASELKPKIMMMMTLTLLMIFGSCLGGTSEGYFLYNSYTI
jgi:hypothetical protein